MDDPKSASSDSNEQDKSNDPLNQPFDDKQPETYVTPSGEPTSIAPMATPLSLQKPKNHSGRWLFRGFVVLLIAVLGALAYWQWVEAQSAQAERESLQTELNTVKMAYEDVTDTEVVAEEDTTSVPSDKELIATEASSYLAASPDSKFKIDDKTLIVKDGYAVVKASLPTTDEGGKTIVMKKADMNWVVLYGGLTDELTTNEKNYLVKEFSVPESLLK